MTHRAEGEPVEPPGQAGSADDISGVDNWVEEGGPLEPIDFAASSVLRWPWRTWFAAETVGNQTILVPIFSMGSRA